MTTIHRSTYWLLLVILFSTGCSKWLDVKPKTYVNESDLWKDEQGFKDALTGVYVAISDTTLYGKNFTMGMMDVLGGNYDVANSFHVYNKAGSYQYTDATTKAIINEYWNKGYNAIANLNNLLANIDSRKSLFVNNNYNIVKGEALGLRALLHFDLLRAFGGVPALGLDKKSIPYVTQFSMTVKPNLTMNEVLDACLKDLLTARDLLAVYQQVNYGIEDLFLSHTRNHMNYWAVTGLMARIYLYKNDLENAYKMAKAVIDGGRFNFIDVSSVSTTYPNRLFSPEHLFAVYSANQESINASLFKSSAGTNNVLTNKTTFINTLFEIASGGSTDYRYLYLWKTEGSSSTKYPAKYWMDDLLNGNGNSIRRVPVLRYSEMFYIAAEATASLTEKTTLLNQVRQKRGLPLLANNLTAEQLDNEIFKEYRKEFYQEGQLFFYYKRKNSAQIAGSGIAGSPAVYVLPIPDDEIEFNHG
ncbi:RagB/SusD family nutrient uptake outer membrane protein [Chitinophaga sp. CB10]|uniref:RagB/SusD family nutrient uptake outer membrane protein n=1 Tax=Chitinophaga sp. CB10 TaxID=1891659 RepID=UPI000B07E4C0|nr:RagB/SusD family nutrient uptake outer membrane protein [Chitinophaga sp. CB10]